MTVFAFITHRFIQFHCCGIQNPVDWNSLVLAAFYFLQSRQSISFRFGFDRNDTNIAFCQNKVIFLIGVWLYICWFIIDFYRMWHLTNDNKWIWRKLLISISHLMLHSYKLAIFYYHLCYISTRDTCDSAHLKLYVLCNFHMNDTPWSIITKIFDCHFRCDSMITNSQQKSMRIKPTNDFGQKLQCFCLTTDFHQTKTFDQFKVW